MLSTVTSRIVSLLLVIGITACLFSIAYHMVHNKYETETAILYTTDDFVSFSGVYVRDEATVKYGGNGVVRYCISDGGKLGKGSVIAEIYSDESQIDVNSEITLLENELELIKKIQNRGTIELAQPANISGLIEDQYKDIINNREKGKLDEVNASRDNLLVLMSTYQLITDSEIDLQGRTAEINGRISELKRSTSVPLDTIVSDSSAYFASYADGYEDKLNVSSLAAITADDIKNAKEGTKSEDPNVIGKIIRDYEWYIAGVINNSDQFCSVGDTVPMKFRSTSDISEGTVYDIRPVGNDSESIIIIRCNDITYDLVQHRTETVDIIKNDYEGIKIPRKAIRFRKPKPGEISAAEDTDGENGEEVDNKGVYVKIGEQIVFKKIKVVYEGDSYVLSALNAGDGYVSLYDDIVVEGLDEEDEN